MAPNPAARNLVSRIAILALAALATACAPEYRAETPLGRVVQAAVGTALPGAAIPSDTAFEERFPRRPAEFRGRGRTDGPCRLSGAPWAAFGWRRARDLPLARGGTSAAPAAVYEQMRPAMAACANQIRARRTEPNRRRKGVAELSVTGFGRAQSGAPLAVHVTFETDSLQKPYRLQQMLFEAPGVERAWVEALVADLGPPSDVRRSRPGVYSAVNIYGDVLEQSVVRPQTDYFWNPPGYSVWLACFGDGDRFCAIQLRAR